MFGNSLLYFINFIYYFDHIIVCTTYWFYLSEYLTIEYLIQFYGFIFLCHEALLRISIEITLHKMHELFNYVDRILLLSSIFGVLLNIVYFIRPPVEVLIITRILYSFCFFASNLLSESLSRFQSREEKENIIIYKRIIQSSSTIVASIYVVAVQFIPTQKIVLIIQSTNISGVVLAIMWLIYAICILCNIFQCLNRDDISYHKDELVEKEVLAKEMNLDRDKILSIFTFCYLFALMISLSTKFALNLVLAPLGAIVFDLSMKHVAFIFIGLNTANFLIYFLLKIKSETTSSITKLIIMTVCVVSGMVLIVISIAAKSYSILEKVTTLSLFVFGYFVVNVAQSGAHLLIQNLLMSDKTIFEQMIVAEMKRSFKSTGCLLGILIGPVVIVWPNLSLTTLTLFWVGITVFSIIFYQVNKKL